MDERHLSEVPLFAGLGRADLRRIAQLADEVDVREGKELLHEGAFAYEFFAIEKGTAEVTAGGEHVADLGPGDFFGEMGALSKDTRTATVTATSPVTAIVMSAKDFRRLASESPEIARKIEQTIEERTRTAL